MEDYKNTLSTICNFVGDQHPWINAAMAEKHKLNLSNKLLQMHNHTVSYGPFKGQKFVDDSHWGAPDKGSMILGLYEQEVLTELTSVPPNYDVFIDLGAADGYYGVGVLVNDLFKKSYCYEITDLGKDVISKNAKINNVEHRVAIRGEATKNFYNEIPPSDRDNAVLFVDIEGAEFEIFDKNLFDQFSKSVIFVELHNWIFPDGDQKLNKFLHDSSGTHTYNVFKTGSRDLSNYPELEQWNDLDRWLLCSEGRAQLMSWVRFDPL